MPSLESRLAELEKRLRKVEDEQEINGLLVKYGMAADTGDAERTAAVFTQEGVYDVDVRPPMVGRKGVREMVLGEGHQSLLPNAAHTVGPLAVKVDGDRALAVGYARTYRRRGDEIYLWRLSYTRVELERRGGRWQIARRVNRLVGHKEAWPVFQNGLKELEE